MLLLGDCKDILKEYPDNHFDLIVTDPPYGIGINKMDFVTSGAIKSRTQICKRNDYSKHKTQWDDKRLSKDYFDEMFRVSRNQIIFGANNYVDYLPPSRCWLIWDKRVEDKYSNDFADCELAYTSFDKPSRIIRFLWSGMFQGDMKNKEKRYHPTQKPVKVMMEIIKMFTDEGDLILDPFCGVGSTYIACMNLNRQCIGIEINPEYLEIAKARVKPLLEQTKLV